MREKREINIRIGDNIRHAREAAGLTQERFSEMVSLATKNVSDIERGVVGISVGTLLRICQTLHVTPDEILTDSENEVAPSLDDLMERLNSCSSKDRETALKLLKVYLQSLT